MSAALDHDSRAVLEHFVQRARRLFEDDLAREAEGRFGIHLANGLVEDEDGLHLDASAVSARRAIVEVLEFLSREEPSVAEAVARLVREAAFTHLNRLIAIRIAEAIQLLPESLANGPASAGFKELLDVAPLLAHDVSGGYWRYLQLCGDELAADLPQLFDPRNPLLELSPSAAALDELVEMISSSELVAVWGSADAFGWAYQFFNSGDERRAMREASPSPRSSRELAVRNQFFTPGYVVDFLVHNSLGRRLLEANPESGLADHLPMLLNPPTEKGAPLDLADVRVIDPACGSGHFLLGAYDVLEHAWALQGVSAEDAAPLIVGSLWGIDIDARCAQVASAAVILRARLRCKAHPLPSPNIVTARALPEPLEGWEALLASLPGDRAQLVGAMRDALHRAPVLGALLKVEEHLATEIRDRVAGADNNPATLFGVTGVAKDSFGQAEADVLRVLQSIADQTTSGPSERLFAAEANDAIRLVEVLRHRYDAVLMNPPYGLAPEVAEQYMRSAYPKTWTDLYAAFLERGLSLADDYGYVAAITSSQYLTTRKMRGLRESFARDCRPVAIIDLGSGVLQGAAVNTALSVVPRRRSTGETSFLDLTRVPVEHKESELISKISIAQSVDLGDFLAVPGVPFALHVAEGIGQWVSDEQFEPDVAIVRTGGNTFDNFRFVRCRWEISPRPRDGAWVPYEKGGDFRPYFGSAHLLLDWRSDGEELKEFGKGKGVLPQVMQSSSHWRRAGLCYPRANKSLGVRVMPAGEIFAEKGIAVFPNNMEDAFSVLGFLNSASCVGLVAGYGRSRFIENSAIKRLPVGSAHLAALAEIGEIARDLVMIFYEDECQDECSAVFTLLSNSCEEFVAGCDRRVATARELQKKIDNLVERVVPLPAQADGPDISRSDLVASALLGPIAANEEWPTRAFSYLFGLAMGRWRSDGAEHAEIALTERSFFEALPEYPPGMNLAARADDQGSEPARVELPSPHSGLLLDEPGHPRDIETAMRRAGDVFFSGHPEAFDELVSSLGHKAARSYVRSKFFKSHLARYSRSRRKAPIYWPLTVPSGQWGVWAYAPLLTRESLYAVASEALRREGHAEAEVLRLERERLGGGSGRGAKALDKALDDERKLGEELRRFRQEAERIAGLGWEPDLDDGIVLCAAPLADLFPMWKEPALYREELRAGKYEWSTVSKWADQL